MYEIKTNKAEDVLTFYNSVNKVKTKDDYVWQKILFSENVLTNTNDIWGKKYKKIHMQALQVLTLLNIDKNYGKDGMVFYSQIIQYLISLKENLSSLDVVSMRKQINKTLVEYLEHDSVYINNFADILFEQAESIENETLPTKFDDFITTNIFCFSLYDIQFCEGRVGIESYDGEALSNNVLIKSAFGNLVLNNVIVNNAKMILELSSTMIKNKKSNVSGNNRNYERVSYQPKQEKSVEEVVRDVISTNPTDSHTNDTEETIRPTSSVDSSIEEKSHKIAEQIIDTYSVPSSNAESSEDNEIYDFNNTKNLTPKSTEYINPKPSSNTASFSNDSDEEYEEIEEIIEEVDESETDDFDDYEEIEEVEELEDQEELEVSEMSENNNINSRENNVSTPTHRRKRVELTPSEDTNSDSYEEDDEDTDIDDNTSDESDDETVVENDNYESDDESGEDDDYEIDDNDDFEDDSDDEDENDFEDDDDDDEEDGEGEDVLDDEDSLSDDDLEDEVEEDDFDYQYDDDELEYDDDDDNDDDDDDDNNDDDDDEESDEESENFVVESRRVKKTKLSFVPRRKIVK